METILYQLVMVSKEESLSCGGSSVKSLKIAVLTLIVKLLWYKFEPIAANILVWCEHEQHCDTHTPMAASLDAGHFVM